MDSSYFSSLFSLPSETIITIVRKRIIAKKVELKPESSCVSNLFKWGNPSVPAKAPDFATKEDIAHILALVNF